MPRRKTGIPRKFHLSRVSGELVKAQWLVYGFAGDAADAKGS